MAMYPSREDLQREYPGWSDIDALIDHLMPQFAGEYDGLLMIAPGGLIPGGCLVEAMDIEHVLTATVHFAPAFEGKMAWPTLVQFPSDALLVGRRILVVNNIWANGRTIMFVKGRVAAAGARAETAVLHYRPGSSLFNKAGPDYYGAITDRYIVYPWELPPLVDTTAETRPSPPVN
ncbi:MAG: phosphoribosyltransferase family protein [Anaerolineae bacterium]